MYFPLLICVSQKMYEEEDIYLSDIPICILKLILKYHDTFIGHQYYY